MQIEGNGDAERIVAEEVARGRFDSAEAAVHQAILSLPERREQPSESPQERLRRKIAEQGVAPLVDGSELYGDFWPEDETADDIIAFVRGQGTSDTHRESRQ